MSYNLRQTHLDIPRCIRTRSSGSETVGQIVTACTYSTKYAVTMLSHKNKQRHTLTTLGDRTFPVAAARVWNTLPPSSRAKTSLQSFRRDLKTTLFKSRPPLLTDSVLFCLIIFVKCPCNICVKRHFNLCIYNNNNNNNNNHHHHHHLG